MKIERLIIKNFRSIKDLELKLNPRINVFIGANNVGKSNVLSAIEWLTGPSYPTANRLDRWDFYEGNEELDLKISLDFDDGNRLSFDSTWIDNYGREKHGLNINGGYVSDDTRSKYVSASIGADRHIKENPASSQWNLLGRMLKEFNERLFEETVLGHDGQSITKADAFKERMEEIRDDILFSIEGEDGENLMQEMMKILQEETARQLNCSPADLSVDLNAYDPWNLYKTLQIFVTDQSNGLQMRASDLGMGVQASLTIAILRAYSKLKLRNQTPIIIDEPELYLHPQARRKFYQVLEELADSGTQVFLTTHSTEFVDIGRFDQIFLVRKSTERGTYAHTATPQAFIDDLKARFNIDTDAQNLMLQYKNAFENTGDAQRAAEGLFASKIVLVEGESESLILPYCFEKIGYDYISEGITIVRCGGKNELDRFFRLYSEFGIPCFILFDGDGQNQSTQDESHTIKANKAVLSLFGETADFPDGHVHDAYLGFKTTIEPSLKLGPIGKSTKGIKLFIKFKEAYEAGSIQIPQWIPLIIEKLDNLPNEAKSVLIPLEADDECLWLDDYIPF